MKADICEFLLSVRAGEESIWKRGKMAKFHDTKIQAWKWMVGEQKPHTYESTWEKQKTEMIDINYRFIIVIASEYEHLP